MPLPIPAGSARQFVPHDSVAWNESRRLGARARFTDPSSVQPRVADPYGFSCGSGSGSGSSDPYGFHADPDPAPDPDPT